VARPTEAAQREKDSRFARANPSIDRSDSTRLGVVPGEYKTIAGKVFGDESLLDEAINNKAAQGWEFVSASPSFEQWGFAVMRRAKK